MKKKKHDDSALSCSLIRRPIQRWGWLFLLPTFAAFCVGFLYPFAKGLFLSFCKFKTTSKWTWVGLKNYQTIFQDEGFLHAFWYTALFALVSLLIINVLAFAVAYVLTKGIKGSNIFRTVFFMPSVRVPLYRGGLRVKACRRRPLRRISLCPSSCAVSGSAGPECLRRLPRFSVPDAPFPFDACK